MPQIFLYRILYKNILSPIIKVPSDSQKEAIKMAIHAYTVSDFRENLKAITDDVFDYNETVIITRPKKRNVVMISEAEYNSWQETLHLLGTTANQEALTTSLKQLDHQNTHILTPEDWANLKLQDDDTDE